MFNSDLKRLCGVTSFFLYKTTKQTLYDLKQGAYTGTPGIKLDKQSIIPVILQKIFLLVF